MTIEFEFRKIRNALLRDSDWTQANDSPLSAEQKQTWAVYRQSLRDLPQNSTPSFDENNKLCGVQWPVIPN